MAAHDGGVAPSIDDRPAGRRPPGLLIRHEPYDNPAALRLVAAQAAEVDERYAGEVDEPEDIEHWVLRPAQVTPPHGTFVVAYLDSEAVGCGAIRPLPGGPDGVAEIKRMYTAPTARGRGVGRAVLATLETEARRLGYRRLQLATGLRQPEAIALYQAGGYHRIAPYGEYAASSLEACFAKDLGSTPR